jgi:DNA replication protein DnaC
MNETRCEACQGAGYRVGRAGELALATVCECQDRCARCGGQRFVIESRGGYDVAVPCSCTQAFRRVRAFNDARIPAAYGQKLLASGADDAAGFRDRGIPSLSKAKLLVNRYQQMRLDGGDPSTAARGLVLAGGPGLGKTHLVCALLRYLTLERGVGCRFVDYYQLLAHIRSTFDGQGHETEATILAPLVEVPVLVLDDLGKGQATAWEWTIVDQLITRRYNAGRVVLATTNFPLAEELERRRQVVGPGGRRAREGTESLEDRIGERLVSRLRETAEFALLDGADYRVQLGSSGRTPTR